MMSSMPFHSWTPGRVNLIGEYIDFNGGTVLPAALPLGVEVQLSTNTQNQDQISSDQFDDPVTAKLNEPASNNWADYVRGALQLARKIGWLEGGYDVHLTSTVPVGSGVSSSAAVSVGVLTASAQGRTRPTQIAQYAQQIEHDFIGVPCGIMDQMAVAHAKPGQALALNTIDLSFETINIPQGWYFAVFHCGVHRQLTDGRYQDKQKSCYTARDILKLDYLCQASDLSILEPEILSIANHVVSEHKRTLLAIEAIKRGDLAIFGQLMCQSHNSLRDDFGNSIPEIDALIDDAMTLGACGARLTGAGFGGCIVVLLDNCDAMDWAEPLLSRHPKAFHVATLNGSGH